MGEPSRTAVLVVTFNHEDEIEDCIDAALAQASDDHSVEVVVCDNASGDGTRGRLAGYGDRITVVAMDENVGFAAGMNAAFAASTAGDVLFLNPDAVMDRGSLDALHAHLRSEPRCGAAAAFLRSTDGSPQAFARRDPDLAAVLATSTYVGRLVDARRGDRAMRRRTYADEWQAGFAEPLPVDCPAAACVLVRRELVDPRPMDPALPLFFNDAELARRLRADGWRLDVVPQATALHGGGTSIRRSDAVLMRAEWVAATRRYLRPALGPAGRAALNGALAVDALVGLAADKLGRGGDDAATLAVGTLGGLGLPGGPPPPLTPVRRLALRGRAGSRRSL